MDDPQEATRATLVTNKHGLMQMLMTAAAVGALEPITGRREDPPMLITHPLGELENRVMAQRTKLPTPLVPYDHIAAERLQKERQERKRRNWEKRQPKKK